MKWGNITSVATLVSIMGSLIFFVVEYGDDIGKVHKLMSLNPDSLEHVMGDLHTILHSNSQFRKDLDFERIRNVNQGKYYRDRIDSLVLFIDILREGKAPYDDSVWVKDRFDRWFLTSVKKEFEFRKQH